MRACLAVAAMISVTGCMQQSAPVADPVPSQAMRDTFKTCKWEKVESRTLVIWSYACGEDMGNVRLTADTKTGGFALGSNVPDGTSPRSVIQPFPKSANAPVSAILSAVLAATGAHGASCQLVETDYGDWGKVWLLEPTGAERVAYDKANAVEPQANPCGELGIGPAGDRFFRVLADDPTRVIYYDMGSEIQIFDPSTLRTISR
ncbi:hypothetical protein [Asticcacaulis sp. 201]|uniref:hypothetical protein n=1 Tax=Asticcacaulis sp. 201 TaxID=3028787 RepID=UPI002915F93A|nr:hypothetical protein [Asticcacaulis sp. 201]MDV6332147.1 hypothetical protein [Asticcacaulis sp. 201]